MVEKAMLPEAYQDYIKLAPDQQFGNVTYHLNNIS